MMDLQASILGVVTDRARTIVSELQSKEIELSGAEAASYYKDRLFAQLPFGIILSTYEFILNLPTEERLPDQFVTAMQDFLKENTENWLERMGNDDLVIVMKDIEVRPKNDFWNGIRASMERQLKSNREKEQRGTKFG